jgi:hypothetical protein
MALAAGCSVPPAGPDGPERVVFALNGGYKQWGHVTDINEIDLGVTELDNASSHTVRVRWLRLVKPPKALEMDSIVAYPYVGHGGLAVTEGNLLKGPCRTYMKPYPVTDAIMLRVPAAKLEAAAAESGYANLEVFSAAAGIWFMPYPASTVPARPSADAPAMTRPRDHELHDVPLLRFA